DHEGTSSPTVPLELSSPATGASWFVPASIPAVSASFWTASTESPPNAQPPFHRPYLPLLATRRHAPRLRRPGRDDPAGHRSESALRTSLRLRQSSPRSAQDPLLGPRRLR